MRLTFPTGAVPRKEDLLNDDLVKRLIAEARGVKEPEGITGHRLFLNGNLPTRDQLMQDDLVRELVDLARKSSGTGFVNSRDTYTRLGGNILGGNQSAVIDGPKTAMDALEAQFRRVKIRR